VQQKNWNFLERAFHSDRRITLERDEVWATSPKAMIRLQKQNQFSKDSQPLVVSLDFSYIKITSSAISQ
jgi:hypothetical protein